jgi:hypothetical protein
MAAQFTWDQDGNAYGTTPDGRDFIVKNAEWETTIRDAAEWYERNEGMDPATAMATAREYWDDDTQWSPVERSEWQPGEPRVFYQDK